MSSFIHFHFHFLLSPKYTEKNAVRRQPKSKCLLDITRAGLDVASRGAGSGDMSCRSGDHGELGVCKGYPCWFACFGAGEMEFFILYTGRQSGHSVQSRHSRCIAVL